MTEIIPDPADKQDANKNEKPSQSLHRHLTWAGVDQGFQNSSIKGVDGFPPIRFNSQTLYGRDARSCDVPIDSCNLHVSFLVITMLAEAVDPGLLQLHP
jgi:hypothetical protein